MKPTLSFTHRRARWTRWLLLPMIAGMITMGSAVPILTPTVYAQTSPVGAGFVLNAGDLRFIFDQILVAQDHAAVTTISSSTVPGFENENCAVLLGPGPRQVHDPQLPVGLRTVSGQCNNLVPIPNQHLFGASDQLFPRLTTPDFRPAEQSTTYNTTANVDVFDSQPRIISNLIVDQTGNNPAAVAAAANPCGSGGFVCSGPGGIDPVTGTAFIPNITPDFGLSAPFNLTFTFFGQFFDHGLDLVNKGGNGTVIMELQADDPLVVAGLAVAGPESAGGTPMKMNRASVDANHESVNQTTPWVDQNQTYTSHAAHQVFLRQYEMIGGRPLPDGNVLDGSFCAPRANGGPGEEICNIGNWGQVKAQAATKLGIRLVDTDVFNVPLVLVDPYGHFKPGPNGFPQLVLAAGGTREGDPTANGGDGVDDSDAARTNHQFLNDIAHRAAPSLGLVADADSDVSVFGVGTQPAGTYDDELLALHFVTGDGRGNENIALTTMHTIFHAEHNRLRNDIDRQIHAILTPAEVTAWESVHAGSGWGYGERLFQAARVATEMQYQHLVFEEFARTIQPLINPFLGGITSINAAIAAEFAHTVYRLGHSMLPEILARITKDGTTGTETVHDIRLREAFLNPVAFNTVPTGTGTLTLSAAEAVGSNVRGLSREIGNELDEFVVDSVRNTLVGLPLDLPAINIARGRSEGIPRLNVVRGQFFDLTHDGAVAPYPNWFEFGLNLKHLESLVNFVAAYGKGACALLNPDTSPATTLAERRAAASLLVVAMVDGGTCLFDPADTSGLDDVDFWVGGLAERQAVFAGLLGSTFNYVFESQLESLQNGDRFYYLQRLDGVHLRTVLESNSFTELIRRNSDMGAAMDKVFSTADFSFDLSQPPFNGPGIIPLGDGIVFQTLGNGTKLFFDPLHTGKNIVMDGTAGVDRIRADVGDDTLFGNDGADRIDGFEGNDTLIGGDDDDVLLGGNGDDVIKGGHGNDAMQSGPGFGGDILMGGPGDDFLLGGDDGVEHFGDEGNDILVDGIERAEGMFGGTGDDWIDAGDGHDGGGFGDEGNVFDLLAGLSRVGGDDVEDGGPGQDNAFGEGGDDVFLQSEGSNKFFGDYGFDWITYRGWPAPASIELFLLADPNAPLNFNDLRNKYRFTDGASGWDFNDVIRGSKKVLCTPPGEVAECLIPGMELNAAGAAKITGLTELMGPTGFNQDLNAPAIPCTDPGCLSPFIKEVGFMGGDILLGGLGSDTLEGKPGDDLIDGDLWLNVQLHATPNPGGGAPMWVDSARLLTNKIFSDPQKLNPGNIDIVKTIVTPGVTVNPTTGLPYPGVPPADCGAPAPLNCDTAVFNFPLAHYIIALNPNGTLTVTHVPALPKDVPADEGTDTLRNIEQLQFTDVTIPTSSITTTPVPVASVTPASAALAFGSVTTGTTSGTQLITLTNIGIRDLVVSGVVITPGEFTILADTCTAATLLPGGSCTISVAFAPTADGPASGSVTITHNAAGSPEVITLSGTGVAPVITTVVALPTTVNFSRTRVGATRTRTVLVTNLGPGPLTVDSVSTNAPFSADLGTCAAVTVAPGATCRLNASFTPTIAGPASRTLLVFSNASNSPATTTLAASRAVFRAVVR